LQTIADTRTDHVAAMAIAAVDKVLRPWELVMA
jgi:hypothetical protein